jgi:hypothetical protein
MVPEGDEGVKGNCCRTFRRFSRFLGGKGSSRRLELDLHGKGLCIVKPANAAPCHRPALARVARELRVLYPGAVYPAMNRRGHREPIFRSHKSRDLFLGTLGRASEKAGWQVHVCCLMSNHAYPVARTLQPRPHFFP